MPYLLYLLETMLEVLRDDHNAHLFVGQGFSEQLNCLLRQAEADGRCFGKRSEDLVALSLECLSLFVVNNQAKVEVVQSNTVAAIESRLTEENHVTLNSALRVLMFVAIHPEGRKTIIDYKDYLLLRKFKRLARVVDRNVRENLTELLTTLAEDVLRFKQIFNSIEEEED